MSASTPPLEATEAATEEQGDGRGRDGGRWTAPGPPIPMKTLFAVSAFQSNNLGTQIPETEDVVRAASLTFALVKAESATEALAFYTWGSRVSSTGAWKS